MTEPVVLDNGNVRLYCGDCLDIMASWPECFKVDAVVTDPPYGLGIEYASFEDSRENVRRLAGDWLPLARRVSSCVAFTPGLGMDREYPAPDHTACWLMEAGGYRASWGFGMWQPILCYGKDRYLATGKGARPDVIRTNGTDRRKPCHPCPKPEAPWTAVLVRFSIEGDAVLDPFMGSGSTLVAAKRLGFRSVGIEQEPEHVEQAKLRVGEALKSDGLLFDIGA